MELNLYLITCLTTGGMYVGKTTQPLQERWWAHLGAAKAGRGYHLHRAMRKYGVENFVIEPIICLDAESDPTDEQSLNAAEVKMIRLLRVNCKLYNICDGGEGTSGYVPSPEHRRHTSEANKGQTVSEAQRQATGARFRGKPWSEARRAADGGHSGGQHRGQHGQPKTHCIHGHERTPDNVSENGTCKKCKAIWQGSTHPQRLITRRGLQPQRRRAVHQPFDRTVLSWNRRIEV